MLSMGSAQKINQNSYKNQQNWDKPNSELLKTSSKSKRLVADSDWFESWLTGTFKEHSSLWLS